MSPDQGSQRSFLGWKKAGRSYEYSKNSSPCSPSSGSIGRAVSTDNSSSDVFQSWDLTQNTITDLNHSSGKQEDKTTAASVYNESDDAGTSAGPARDSNGEVLLPDCPRSPHRQLLQDQRVVSLHRSASKDHPVADMQPTKENSRGASVTHGIQKKMPGAARR
jgi:hypothetical protein